MTTNSSSTSQQQGGSPGAYPQSLEPTPSMLANQSSSPTSLPVESQPYYAQYLEYLSTNHSHPLTYQQWLPEWLGYIASGKTSQESFTQWREEENHQQYNQFIASHPQQASLSYENWLTIKYSSNPGVAQDIISDYQTTAVCQDDSNCNTVYGQGQNRCDAGRCRCRYGDGPQCQLLPTYYQDPRNMTPIQIIRFKQDAQLSKMTTQDYQNWLLLYSPDPEDLPLLHQKNLFRVQRKESVTVPTQTAVDSAQERYRQEVPASSLPPGSVVQPQNGNSQSQLVKGGDGSYYLKVPQVEADSSNNYRFTDNHTDTTGYASDSSSPDPLEWARFQPGADIDERYLKLNDKLTPFKTTPIASWFTANQGLSLADIYGDTSFDPAFQTTYKDWS